MILRTLVFIFFVNSSFARTYFISTTGDDLNDGASLARPWRTLKRLNRIEVSSSDSVLLEGGAAFAGNLVFASPEKTNLSGIRIGSFGQGQATLQAGRGNGILCTNISRLTIENLIIEGSLAALPIPASEFFVTTLAR